MLTTVGRLGVLNGAALMALEVFMPHSDAQTSAPTFTALYNLKNQNGDGRAPYAGLVSGPNGVLYRTTFRGGTSDSGTVFQLAPPSSPGGTWTETVLHSFSGTFNLAGDGDNPHADLVVEPNGTLYGTTYYGGTDWAGSS